MTDQAAKLREVVARETSPPPAVATLSIGPSRSRRPGDHEEPTRLARAVAVTSGKGGVGKSNIAVNLAVVLSGLGLRVCLLDADLGMANADVLCRLTPRRTLEHVIRGECRLADAAILAPGGFRLIPGASGVAGLADLKTAARERLLRELSTLEQVADVLLIDTGAGISANVLGFAAAAHTVMVVTTPEPTSLMDGYGLIKSLARLPGGPRALEVIVNQVRDDEEGREVFGRLSRVSETFLRHPLRLAGTVPQDQAVPDAVRSRMPVTLGFPEAPATIAIRAVARHIAGLDEEVGAPREGFFGRLAGWLGLS